MLYTPTYLRGNPGGVIASNSTTTPLNNGSTFTGEWVDVSRWSAILVRVKTDQDGAYTIQFSTDGTNVDSTLSHTYVTGQINAPKRLVTGVRFARVTFTNNSGSNQTYLRLQTSVGEFTSLTSTMNGTIGADFDAIVSRTLSPDLSVARGDWEGISQVDKFGYCPSVNTTERLLWGVNAAFNGFLTTATTVKVKANGSAGNDDASGSGARSVIVEGLDANFDVASEEIATAGTSASSATSTSFIRVFRAYVGDCGVYHGENDVAMTIENSGGGTDLAYIAAGVGQTEMAIRTVPAGYTGLVSKVSFFAAGNKVVEGRLFRSESADIVSAPFKPRRLIRRFPGLDGSFSEEFSSYIEVPEKSDIWLTAFTSGGTADVSGSYEMTLVKN